MLTEYIALALFALAAIFVPLSLVLSSKLIRLTADTNDVAQLNYESGEESVGSRIAIMSEYLHYFTSFLAFEVAGAVMLLWAALSGGLPFSVNAIMLAFFFVAFALSIMPVLVARAGRGAKVG